MTAARLVPTHRAVKAGHPDHPHFICADCMTPWPCRHVAHCGVCGRLWSEHTDREYRLGCGAPRR